ncbi:hypothetical protein UFOVP26_46 [uncultured Caudovirales phage]|uniref:Uncharacterized protein n=1 Tax=uncultured Caudovirales phage TaxID=2100421 RepID=A0A6J7WM53_9CAUD|nr:hypothetical protein UFOVP26_46 [uncultured Caudovirales phage]CAB4123768.1 hypothetical protein UFOVP44_51 [uncultured Caudovirales phage]CAB5219179.1 hypothetical protein UFOVP220_42 [uncultured Caudovirales phage]
MRKLVQYCEQKNDWDAIFGRDARYNPYDLTQQDCERLANSLSGELSPENLTCDGELSYSQVKAKAQYLNGVVGELQAYAATKGFAVPEIDY